MRVLLSFLFAVLSALTAVSQTDTVRIRKEEPMEYSAVDVRAEFEGGNAAMMKYVGQQIRFPPRCLQDSLFKGCKVYLKFIVDETGRITNVTVLKGCSECRDCDREARRVIENMPLWKPALIAGRPVKSINHIPISYKVP